MCPRLITLVLCAVLLAGCGDKKGAQTTTAVTTAPVTQLTVYYYNYKNALVPVTVPVAHTEAVATAALTALISGAPHGYRSALTGDISLKSVAISNGVASVRLAGGTLSHAAMGQVVYTLTRFPTITSVDGQTRGDYADLTPNAAIFIAEPLRDSEVPSPVHASGTADVFEATLAVDVWSGGKKLRTETLTATAGTGTRGDWSATFDLPPGPAKLVFYEPSAEDGHPLHQAELDLTVK